MSEKMKQGLGWCGVVLVFLGMFIFAFYFLDDNRIQQKAMTNGQRFHVTLYSATGVAVREWYTEGKVIRENSRNEWLFINNETKKGVRVSGTIVIEQM